MLKDCQNLPPQTAQAFFQKIPAISSAPPSTHHLLLTTHACPERPVVSEVEPSRGKSPITACLSSIEALAAVGKYLSPAFGSHPCPKTTLSRPFDFTLTMILHSFLP